MKIRASLLLVFICLSMALVLCSPASAGWPELVVIDVHRNAHLQEHGILLTNDTFNVMNEGLDAAFYVMAAFPLDEMDHVQHFHAETAEGAALLIQRIALVGPNCTGWKIYLPEPIMPGKNFTFRALMALEGLTELGETIANCTFSTVPTSPYLIKQFTTTFTHYIGITAPSRTEWTGVNVRSYSYRPYRVTFEMVLQAGTPNITYLQLKRQFTVDPWGYLFVLESHKFRVDSINYYGWDWRAIDITLPPGCQFIQAYDNVANLTGNISTTGNLTQPTEISLDLQFRPEQGDVYQFFVEYRCPLDLHQFPSTNGMFLEFNRKFEYPWIIRHQITEIVLPTGSWLLDTSPRAEVTVSSTGQYLVQIHDYNVSFFHETKFNLQYVYPLQPASTRPILFSLIVGVICLLYLGGRRIPFFREEEMIITTRAEIDPLILGEFCALYGEKVALLLQTERLERSMLAQKISKPRYRKERKIFERKLRALDKELQGRSAPLKEAGGKYEASVHQLELLEAERLSAIEAIRALDERYKRRRITPTVYQKLRSDLEKRRDKAISSMDRILLDLREEINA